VKKIVGKVAKRCKSMMSQLNMNIMQLAKVTITIEIELIRLDIERGIELEETFKQLETKKGAIKIIIFRIEV